MYKSKVCNSMNFAKLIHQCNPYSDWNIGHYQLARSLYLLPVNNPFVPRITSTLPSDTTTVFIAFWTLCKWYHIVALIYIDSFPKWLYWIIFLSAMYYESSRCSHPHQDWTMFMYYLHNNNNITIIVIKVHEHLVNNYKTISEKKIWSLDHLQERNRKNHTQDPQLFYLNF